MPTVRRLAIAGLVLLCSAAMSACGFAHVQVSQAMTGGARFDKVVVGDIVVESYEKNPDAVRLNARFHDLISRLLPEELGKRYAIVERSASPAPGTLVVNVRTDIQYGNRGLRYLGAGGQGAVDSTLTAVDAATGAVQVQVTSQSDMVMGLFGGSMPSTVDSNIRALVEKAGLAVH